MVSRQPKRHSRKPRNRNKKLMARKRKRSKRAKRSRKPPRKKVRKRGPKSYKSQSKRPSRQSKSERMVWRVTDAKSPDTLNAYRAGYKACWKHAKRKMREYKMPKPGDFNKENIHNGKLWATKREARCINGDKASRILECCFKAGCSEAQCRQVMKLWSYTFFLKSGKTEENFPDVKEMWKTFFKFSEPTKRLKPDRVPTLQQIKKCLTTLWHKKCGMALYDWLRVCCRSGTGAWPEPDT